MRLLTAGSLVRVQQVAPTHPAKPTRPSLWALRNILTLLTAVNSRMLKEYSILLILQGQAACAAHPAYIRNKISLADIILMLLWGFALECAFLLRKPKSLSDHRQWPVDYTLSLILRLSVCSSLQTAVISAYQPITLTVSHLHRGYILAAVGETVTANSTLNPCGLKCLLLQSVVTLHHCKASYRYFVRCCGRNLRQFVHIQTSLFSCRSHRSWTYII